MVKRVERVLAASCVVALCVLGAEWMPAAPPPRLQPVRPEGRAAAASARQPDRAGAARIILARPLFSARRRPPTTVLAARGAHAAAAPRLSGTLISPHGRVAVFKTASGPSAARLQGQTIDGFTVEAVQPGLATLWDGRSHLRLTVRPDALSGGFVSSIDTAIVAYPGNQPAPRLANRTDDGQREE